MTTTQKFGITREERQFGTEREMMTIYRSPELMKASQFGYEWVGPYSEETKSKVRNLERALNH